jgi:serine/threonine-protein kinase
VKGEAGERVLGRFRLEHPIGEGGFGCVFLGRQDALDREVAIKAARPGRRDDDGVRERFRREALLVAGINHPNVVTYHDFGVDEDGDLVLVMEHLQGCSLLDVLRRRRPVPLADVARWMADAAAGLHEAHARGLVHRDVKPSNLFLVAPGTRSERLKVIDFGILLADRQAHPELVDLTRSDAFIGTPEYVAPEMMLGRNLDGRADQYALALVAFELIAGRRPFPPADDGGLLIRLSERPEALDFRDTGRRVPPAVSAALWKALSPSPAERFPTITAFGDALRDAVAGFDEEGHGDRTRIVRDAASDPTRTLSTVDEEQAGAGADARRTPNGAPRGKPALRRAAWPAAGLLVAGLAVGVWLAVPGAGSNASNGDAAVVAGIEPANAAVVAVPPPAVPSADAPAAVAVAAAAAPIPSVPAKPVPDLSLRVAQPRSRPPSSESAARVEPASAAVQDAAPPVAIQAREPEAGILALNAHPWAEVEVDGRAVGRTPILSYKAAAGSHRIEFRHPSLGTQVVTRNLAAGTKEVVSVRFE